MITNRNWNWIGAVSLGILMCFFWACDDHGHDHDHDPKDPVEVKQPTPAEQAAVDNGPEGQILSLTTQIETNPTNYKLYEERSRYYYSLDSLEAAGKDLEKALELYPGGPDLHYLKGFYAFVTNDTVAALQSYKEAARLGCENPENYYQMGQIFFFQENDKMALEMYDQAITLAPEEPIYPFAKGFLAESKGNNREALKQYFLSLANDSSFVKTRLQLHDLYLNQYKNELSAMAQIDTLLIYQPTHPLARFYQGNYHLRRLLSITDETQTPRYKKEGEDAVFNYSLSLNKHPNFVQARYNRGFCYFLAQNFDLAIEDFNKIVEQDPQNLPALLMLGDIHANFQDLAQAKNFYARAVEANPNSQDAKMKLAEVEKGLR